MQTIQQETRHLLYAGQNISYNLLRKKVKNINMRVKIDGSISVSANPKLQADFVDQFVLNNAKFILKYQKKFQELNTSNQSKKEHFTGEEYFILGKKVQLQLVESKSEGVSFDGTYLYLKVKDINDFKRKEYLLNKFFTKFCLSTFEEILNDIFPNFAKYKVGFPILRVRDMKTRWGTCFIQKKLITLNKKLIFAQKASIEYVLVHELCHFLCRKHNKDFYRLMANFMPDYKLRKVQLERLSTYS